MATGGCMCGDIAYEYTGEPTTRALCHCFDCRKWTGTAFTSNVLVPRTNFKIIRGSPRPYSAIGSSGNMNTFFFCGNCGSSLYTELGFMPDITCVKSGGLDNGAANHKIDVEFSTKYRLNYLSPISGAEQKIEFD